ncbi:MAG: tRNA-dihydrouridine synthase [Rubrivivax sp.]|nr:tRNA-dihydrouridine synthase [Rubrivivax sp.]
MEGLLDHSLRDVITCVGGVDLCVSEFIRVTDQRLPERVFTRIVPELLNGGRTAAGTPVRAQLLGSDPACLADNAAVLAAIGPHGSFGIDLNFGCPAPTVNRHRGGAVLLDEPELVHAIVAAVRRAVPAAMPVSAKMRLGHRDESRMLDCALAIEAAGASELTVHARTKVHGYRPPAYWDRIATIRAAVRLPVVANGEVWTVADARRCLAESGCDALMLGRGIVTDPGLALAIRGAAAPDWPALRPLVRHYWHRIAGHVVPRHRAGRLKQWLNLLRRRFPQAQVAFDTVRTFNDPMVVEGLLFAEEAAAAPESPPVREVARTGPSTQARSGAPHERAEPVERAEQVETNACAGR